MEPICMPGESRRLLTHGFEAGYHFRPSEHYHSRTLQASRGFDWLPEGSQREVDRLDTL
jgi:hypothetical protein